MFARSAMSWATAARIAPVCRRSFASPAAGRVVIGSSAKSAGSSVVDAAAAMAEKNDGEGLQVKKPRRRLRELKAPMLITESAANRVKELLAKKGDDIVGVRIGVRTRGCNGLSYTMNYATGPEKFEDVVVDKGVTVIIESKALLHVVGTTMDYATDELSAEFVFHNPNAKGMCGCGESFNT